jgi:hypothetical protein
MRAEEHGDIDDAVAVFTDDIEHDVVGFPGSWSVDDNLDDNRHDNYSLNYGNYSPKSLLSCPVTAPARSWHVGVTGSSPLNSTIKGQVSRAAQRKLGSPCGRHRDRQAIHEDTNQIRPRRPCGNAGRDRERGRALRARCSATLSAWITRCISTCGYAPDIIITCATSFRSV